MKDYFKNDKMIPCPCGQCGLTKLDKEFKKKLNKARNKTKTLFIINSGVRCNTYNSKIKNSSVNSSHIKGLAVDIKVENSQERYNILSSLIKAGFTRIGVYSTFIHVDNDKNKVDGVIWHQG